MQGKALIINLPHELLKDALWHYQQAKSLDSAGADRFPVWRHIRSCAVFSVTAVEALLNMEAARYIRENPSLDPTLREYLREQENKVVHGVVKTTFRRVSLEEKITDWTKTITGHDFDRSDALWQRFNKVKEFRDALIHYRPENLTIYREGTVATARDAVDTGRAMILRYFSCLGGGAPPWADEIQT